MSSRIDRVSAEIGYYLAGFADGEGSFNVSFRPRPDFSIPWKISLCFNVSQKDRVILALFKKHLGCGTLRSRPDGVWYYEVNNLTAIVENVIPFFNRFGFLSAKKKRDFSKFKQLAQLMLERQHLTVAGVEKILSIRRKMNDGGKRRYLDHDILERIVESSETTRRAPLSKGDDIVRSSWRHEGQTDADPDAASDSDQTVNTNERS